MTLSDDDGDGMDLFAVQEFFGDTDAVEAADLPGRGQGLVASRDIAAGEALVCETALASVVLDEWRGLVCHQCFSALPTARDEQFPCGCRQVVFCSEECQATATPAHRGAPHSECAALARLDTDILNDSEASAARLFVKLLCRRANELAGATRGDEVTVQAVLDALVSNEDAVSDERLTELEMVAEAVLDAVDGAARIDPDDLLRHLCAEQCNSFGIWGHRGRLLGKLLGFGIFPRLALMNHACLPNATVAQQCHGPRRLLTARALSAVPRGEELLISYSGAALLFAAEERAFWLRKTYLFACGCTLCGAPGAAQPALAREFNAQFRCGRRGCSGLRFPLLGAEGEGSHPPRRVCGTCFTLDRGVRAGEAGARESQA